MISSGEFNATTGFIDNIEDKIGDTPFYISPIIKTPLEAAAGSPIFLDMVDDSVILYDRGEFFKKVLDKLRHRLNELGSKRVFLAPKEYLKVADGTGY